MYPLGSCTMKYNPRVNDAMANLPGFRDLHPFAPDDLAQGALAVNLGTGRGYSVKEMIAAVGSTVGHGIAHVIGPRRPGDIASCYSDPTLARTLLGWSATRDLAAMCADSWHWQSRNPNGYAV